MRNASNMASTLPWEAWLDPEHPDPLPALATAARRRRLEDSLGDVVHDRHGAVALVVSAPANVRWASGFTGSNGWLLVLPTGSVLLTDHRYLGRAATECPGLEVAVTRSFIEVASARAAAAGVASLVFEDDHVTHRQGVQLHANALDDGLRGAVAATGIVERERQCKDPAELARLARACAITDAALDAVLAVGLVGRTERAVAAALEDAFRARGAQVGFESIVAAGPNGAVPHHAPTDRAIGAGELVTIDCGARVDGYHADTTRTVAAGRVPTPELARVFEAVAVAQQRGVDVVRHGIEARQVDAACRDYLASQGLGEAFLHGTGHGVGLDIHEAPAVAATSTATLRPRTALTVEPGVYLPGKGGVRIEDTLVVRDVGPARCLTHAPRSLQVV